MIKEIRHVNKIKLCLEVTLEHPINEIGEMKMYVARDQENNKYIFSIPFHDWTYFKNDNNEIELKCAPTGYNYPKYKKQLIKAMNEAIDIIEN